MPAISDSVRKELMPGGTLRAGIAVGPTMSAVWTARDEKTGKPRGVTVDLAAAIAQRLGVPLAYVEHSSSGAIIESAGKDAWDIAFTPVDAERKKHVAFGPNYFLGESTYMVSQASGIESLAEVDRPGIRVLGVENTATLRSARRTLKTVEAMGVAGLDEAVALFAEGKADAIALGRESLAGLAPKFPGARILDEAFHAAGTAVALPLGRPQALAIVSEIIEALKADGALRRIFDENGMADAAVAPVGSFS